MVWLKIKKVACCVGKERTRDTQSDHNIYEHDSLLACMIQPHRVVRVTDNGLFCSQVCTSFVIAAPLVSFNSLQPWPWRVSCRRAIMFYHDTPFLSLIRVRGQFVSKNIQSRVRVATVFVFHKLMSTKRHWRHLGCNAAFNVCQKEKGRTDSTFVWSRSAAAV